ncbi:uncharacterized protein TRAVEDRAFT_85575, partial [Trametes versicolor FP-101664 SS1]|uniref:uncharacterized protein n=1 Tax=Trametes versicolor (strain FP-101664) TaxID=717944 RepID=UPI0004623DD2
ITDCAQSCIASADLGSCSATDNSCLCQSQTYLATLSSCLAVSCTGADLQQAEDTLTSTCAAVGLTVSLSVTQALPASSASTASGTHTFSTTTGTVPNSSSPTATDPVSSRPSSTASSTTHSTTSSAAPSVTAAPDATSTDSTPASSSASLSVGVSQTPIAA